MAAKPMLGEVELQLVQKIDTEGDQVLAEHGVPALEGDFLQGLGRRAERLTLNGVLTGPEAGDGLKTLREKFRAAEPVSFVADIGSATKVDKVLIEEMGVRDLAGKPERFEYAFALREFLPPPPAQTEEPPPPPPDPDPPPLPTPDVGTLVVEVIVEASPDFDLDLSTVRVMVEGTTESGSSLARTLQNRSANTWEEQIAPGQYTVRAISNPQGMAPAQVRGGQTTPITITLRSGAVVARQFVVHFRFDKAFVEPCMRGVLRLVAARAASSSAEKLLILGHTDKVDDPSYNQSLSERRARALHAFLTFGRARQAAIDEWEALRKPRTTRRGQPTLEDRWDTREYQHILQDLRFYPGNIDGRHGDLTDEAVRAYRCHKGLPPGTQVDDEVWRALIEDYLAQDNLAVPADRFFPNCDSEIVKWLGAGEEDPVDNTAAPHRPSRRVELLFVRADRLSCQVPQPDTFALPQAGAVNNGWCIGPPQPGGNHVCFVTRHLGANGRPQPCSATPGGPFCREPADPATLTLRGSIRDENGAPLPSQPFVIITPKGEFLRRENSIGDGDPAMTDNSGEFSFPDKPAGFYSLEVRPFRGRNFLVRLDGEGDTTIKGNTVCKELRRDQDHLDVVVVNAPIVREIRLPVVMHLMTALHPTTREIRTCPAAAGGSVPQATTLTNDQVRAAFDEANTIWRQARIRFTPDEADIVREFYSFRTECEVDHTEFLIVAERCGVPDAVNVLFFGDLAGTGEAGFGLSPETAAAEGVNASGCAVGDRAQANFGGLPIDITLDDRQRAQVLAHELGHHLNLDHAGDTPADAARLMRPNTSDGSNRTLTPDEVTRARASRAASDDCVPLTLSVSGATRVGSSRSNHFILVQDAAATVTVEAQIPARLIEPSVGTLIMTGGNPGATPLQRTVSGAIQGETQVVATYTSTSGQVITARVVIRVLTFRLRVEGATRVGGADSTEFAARRAPNQFVTIIAELDPAPFCVPSTLVVWTTSVDTNVNAAPDPLRRIVSKANVAQTLVSARLAGVTRSVTIRVVAVDFVANAAPFDTPRDRAQIEGALNANLASLDRGDLFSTQPNSLLVVRADLPGVTTDTVEANLFSNPPAGTTIETLPITLRRLNAGSDRFVSLPLLALPAAIQRGEITPRAPQDLVAIRAKAGGRLRVEVNVPLPAVLRTAEVIVRGRVVFIFAQAYTGSGVTAADARRHIQRASRTWAQAGIEVKERQVDGGLTAPSGLLELDQNVPFNGILTAEERRLLSVDTPDNPARSAVASDVDIYYLQELKRALATAYESEHHPAVIDPGQSGIAITMSDNLSTLENDTTLSHELGHLLLVNWGGNEHLSQAGVDRAANVMHTPASTANDLDRDQVENILQHVAAGDNPFIITEP